jgi:hypothetical protein
MFSKPKDHCPKGMMHSLWYSCCQVTEYKVISSVSIIGCEKSFLFVPLELTRESYLKRDDAEVQMHIRYAISFMFTNLESRPEVLAASTIKWPAMGTILLAQIMLSWTEYSGRNSRKKPKSSPERGKKTSDKHIENRRGRGVGPRQEVGAALREAVELGNDDLLRPPASGPLV